MSPDRNFTSTHSSRELLFKRIIYIYFYRFNRPFHPKRLSSEEQKPFFKEQTIFVVYTARFI